MELYEKNGNAIYILNVLKKYSDENHLLQTKEIKEKIKEIYDVDIDPRTIRRIINLLKEKLGYEISTRNENGLGYYLLKNPETDFEPGEIRAIIDTFCYSNYMSTDISKKIIDKCKHLQSIYENEKLNHYQAVMNDTKTDNKEVIKNIEDIENAIYNHKKIKFTYWKYELNPKLKKVNVNQIKATPYKLVYSLQQFYVICLKDKASKLYTYRIDRMKDIKILKEKASSKIEEKEVEKYIRSSIAMYGGESEIIEFIAHLDLLDMVIEQFGKDIGLRKLDHDTFQVTIKANRVGFKFWALRNIEKVKIVTPISLKNEIRDSIKNIEW